MTTEQKHSSLKDQLTILLHEALVPVKELLGEKKYTNRIRKAVKLITEGIEKKTKHTGGKNETKETKKTDAAGKKSAANPAVKEPVKKAAPVARKAAPKKAQVKKANPAKAPVPVKKAIATKKAPSKQAVKSK